MAWCTIIHEACGISVKLKPTTKFTQKFADKPLCGQSNCGQVNSPISRQEFF